MGRCYSGDISGKFWRGFMDADILECYGEGESVYYCENLGENIFGSEISNLSEDNQESCSSEPTSYFYSFNDYESVLQVLLGRIGVAMEFCQSDKEKYELSTQEYREAFGMDFFEHLKGLVEAKGLTENYIEDKAKIALNTLYSNYPYSDVFGEVCIGLEIVECINRSGSCEFYVEAEC